MTNVGLDLTDQFVSEFQESHADFQELQAKFEELQLELKTLQDKGTASVVLGSDREPELQAEITLLTELVEQKKIELVTAQKEIGKLYERLRSESDEFLKKELFAQREVEKLKKTVAQLERQNNPPARPDNAEELKRALANAKIEIQELREKVFRLESENEDLRG